MNTWLLVSLFRLSKITIFMDPRNNSEEKIRWRLKFLNILSVMFCLLTVAYWLGELVHQTEGFKGSMGMRTASMISLVSSTAYNVFRCLASIYVFVVGRRLISIFN